MENMKYGGLLNGEIVKEIQYFSLHTKNMIQTVARFVLHDAASEGSVF